MERRRPVNSEKARGMREKLRRNLKLQVSFYDEERDEAEWAQYDYIFSRPTKVTPPAPAPAPAPPAAAGVAPPPPEPPIADEAGAGGGAAPQHPPPPGQE